MNKNIIACLVLISIIFSGCQLAVVEAGNPNGEDKLVGVFVTEEYLDLYDFEAFASENNNKLIHGGEVVLDSKYEGRVYGTISENNPNDVIFEDYEGVLFIDASYEKHGENYSRVGSSNQVTQIHISVDDDGKGIEGTILAKNEPVISAVLNPVYVTVEGEIYVTSGSGISMGDEYGGGGSMSMFLSENRTIREGNSESTESFKVKINIESTNDVEHYVLKQMDDNDDQVIAEKIYSNDVPSSIEVSDKTKYMILEKIGVDHEGNPLVERKIINDEEYFYVYFFNESAFAEGYSILLDI
ncbi:MAG: hypothetical protein CVV02_17130 [Firmicutes bacterium HGW-Firmicutes-7]|nr:MAG: hypothetical protein CVV02_17130 [Firmicutes bacterium HGW-Firmicutes-7]